jgi:Tfp pilus assembly protein PilV
MTRVFGGARERRRGVALVLVLAATVLLGSLTLLALHAAVIRVRLAADARWRIEGELVASTALAATRIGHRADLDTLTDGATMVLATIERPDGWSWHAEVARAGALIRIVAFARLRASDGSSWAARRASLMLARNPADTVRVLGSRARF